MNFNFLQLIFSAIFLVALISCEKSVEVEVTRGQSLKPAIEIELMGWQHSSPTNSQSLTAKWLLPNLEQSEIDYQEISIYNDDQCKTSFHGPIVRNGETDFYDFIPKEENTYYYQVKVYLIEKEEILYSRCSKGLVFDISKPNSIKALDWLEKDITPNPTVTADWQVPSEDMNDLDQLKIRIFKGKNCSQLIKEEFLKKNKRQFSFKSSEDGFYSFTLSSIDLAGNEQESTCSNNLEVDTTPPKRPLSLGFIEKSPFNRNAINAKFSLSESGDVVQKSIEVFSNPYCQNQADFKTNIDPKSTQFTINVAHQNTYSYKIELTDQVGNSDISACSPSMYIDMLSPTKATNISWDKGGTQASLKALAKWTPSSSIDNNKQLITFYIDESCTIQTAPSVELSRQTQSYLFEGKSENTYHFDITSIDLAGNRSRSNCSEKIYLDTTAPTLASGLNWKEESPYNQSLIHAKWTPSTATDALYQKVQWFKNNTCESILFSSEKLPLEISSYPFSANDMDTIYFNILTSDKIGNSSSSNCVTLGMEIDMQAPLVSENLRWLEAPGPASTLFVTASWENKEKRRLKEQKIIVFNDAFCREEIMSDASLNTTHTEYKYSTAFLDGMEIYFRVSLTDLAGNQSISECSKQGLTINTSPPGDIIAKNELDYYWINSKEPTLTPGFTWENPKPLKDWSHIQLAIGESLEPSEDKTKNWFAVGINNSSPGISLAGVELKECLTYYPKIRAIDNANSTSPNPHVFKKGFAWDASAPIMNGDLKLDQSQTRQQSPLVSWSHMPAEDNCKFQGYKIALGTGKTDNARNDIQDWLELPLSQTTHQFKADRESFYLVMNKDYFINLIAFDEAGNETFLASAPWRINATADSFPRLLASTDVAEVGNSSIQKITCEIPAGTNRLLTVSLNKDSQNTAKVLSIKAGKTKVALNLAVAREQQHHQGWATRGEIWYLTDDFVNGIPAALASGDQENLELEITWSAESEEKITSCHVFEGVNQASPIASTSENALGFNMSQRNINLEMLQKVNSTSLVSCHHGNTVTSMKINLGINDNLNTTSQGSMINTINENVSNDETYKCFSNNPWRRVIMGININGD